MQHESIPAALVHEAFIQLDLCDPADPKALTETWQQAHTLLRRAGYSWDRLATLLNRDRFRRWENRRSTVQAALSFGGVIKYWFQSGHLNGISREHAFILKACWNAGCMAKTYASNR